jgi:ribonuclease HI
LDAFHAEVIAFLEGIKAVDELGITNIQVETNSIMLKLALETNSFELSQMGGYYARD